MVRPGKLQNFFQFSGPCRGRSSFLSSFCMEMYGLEPLILFHRERECVEVDLIKIGISYI